MQFPSPDLTVSEALEAHKNWLNAVKFKLVDRYLYRYDFSGKSLIEAEFHNCYAVSADFSEADLTAVLFEKCDLTGSDFSLATVKCTVFRDCDLSKVDTKNIKNVEDADFENCHGVFRADYSDDLESRVISLIGDMLYYNSDCIIDRFGIRASAIKNDYLEYLKSFYERLLLDCASMGNDYEYGTGHRIAKHLKNLLKITDGKIIVA